jgi:hypothetical protein
VETEGALCGSRRLSHDFGIEKNGRPQAVVKCLEYLISRSEEVTSRISGDNHRLRVKWVVPWQGGILETRKLDGDKTSGGRCPSKPKKAVDDSLFRAVEEEKLAATNAGLKEDPNQPPSIAFTPRTPLHRINWLILVKLCIISKDNELKTTRSNLALDWSEN